MNLFLKGFEGLCPRALIALHPGYLKNGIGLMVQGHKQQDEYFKMAEVLRDDFLSENEGNVNDALLAACQVLLSLEEELYEARQSASVGFSRSSREILDRGGE